MRRRSRNPLRWIWTVVVLAAILVLRLVPQSVPTGDPTQSVMVERVVDGDTLIISGGTRVRLLGIDTPELARGDHPEEPGAAQARDFLREAVERRQVSLGFDREPYDKYGRRLAYIYRQGRLINEDVIRQGWSPARTRFPYSTAMKERFRRAEREAREQRRGLWSDAFQEPRTK